MSSYRRRPVSIAPQGQIIPLPRPLRGHPFASEGEFHTATVKNECVCALLFVSTAGNHPHTIVIPAQAGIHCTAGTDNTTPPSTAWTPQTGSRGIAKFRGCFPGEVELRFITKSLSHFITNKKTGRCPVFYCIPTLNSSPQPATVWPPIWQLMSSNPLDT